MPRREIPGFMPRSVAQKVYGRSKSSFIRDVDDAIARDDSEFLKHFRVLLNDDSIIEGADATKEAVFAVQSKQPRWYIETALLDTRYWDQGSGTVQEGSVGAESSKRSDQTSDPDVVGLKHRLALAEQQIATQGETISSLRDDKAFYQTELENRRGEIEKLQGFFASVGEAADSAAKLRSGRGDSTDTVDSTVSRNGSTDGRRTLLQRYLPTIHKAFISVRPRR
jgi:hypothetical protein